DLVRTQPVCAGRALRLLDRMHRECARAMQPELVAGAREELQERVAVPGGSVAAAGPLPERARAPRQLATGDEQLGEGVVPGREGGERCDDARRAVTPLRAAWDAALPQRRRFTAGPRRAY